jgi:hypothetical protein
MPLDYNPKDAVMCWPKDDYDATLTKVEDKTSKVKADGSGGNPMQVLTWRVFNNNGQEQLISDYIVIPTGTFKLKQLAVALGRKEEFENGMFQADDHIGCNVKAELVVEESPGYDDKNKIKKIKSAVAEESGYRPLPRREIDPIAAKATVGAAISDEQQFKDDDIPF